MQHLGSAVVCVLETVSSCKELLVMPIGPHEQRLGVHRGAGGAGGPLPGAEPRGAQGAGRGRRPRARRRRGLALPRRRRFR